MAKGDSWAPEQEGQNSAVAWCPAEFSHLGSTCFVPLFLLQATTEPHATLQQKNCMSYLLHGCLNG